MYFSKVFLDFSGIFPDFLELGMNRNLSAALYAFMNLSSSISKRSIFHQTSFSPVRRMLDSIRNPMPKCSLLYFSM